MYDDHAKVSIWGWRDLSGDRPTTDRMLELSTSCGFNEVTEKTVDEVWTRIRLWQSLFERNDVTRDIVADHVGLCTNAIAFSTHQFLRRLWGEAKRINDFEKAD